MSRRTPPVPGLEIKARVERSAEHKALGLPADAKDAADRAALVRALYAALAPLLARLEKLR